MDNINNLISSFYNMFLDGDFYFKGRFNDNYLFEHVEKKYELLYNIDINSVTLYEFKTNKGKVTIGYISNNNVDLGLTKVNNFLYNSLLEIIFDMSIDEKELGILNYAMKRYLDNEDYNKADKINTRIKFIKNILKGDNLE